MNDNDIDSDTDNSNPIIRFKRCHNRTSTEYRSVFALDAAHLLALRTLCKHIEEDEFTEIITILLLGIAQLLDNARKEEEMICRNHPMASFNTLASESTNSMISGLQSSDDSDSFYSNLSSLSSLDFNSDTEEE